MKKQKPWKAWIAKHPGWEKHYQSHLGGMKGFTSPKLAWSNMCVCVCVCVCVCAQLCPTFCEPMDCSLPGFSVHGISQARIPDWVAISFSRESSWPRDQTCVSWVLSLGRWTLYHCATWEAWFNIHQVKGGMATPCENSNPAIRNKWNGL